MVASGKKEVVSSKIDVEDYQKGYTLLCTKEASKSIFHTAQGKGTIVCNKFK